MDEQEFNECLKIHGYESSENESDNESKIKLDDLYEAFKPPPILIDPKKHKIIEIGTPSNSEFVNLSVTKPTKSQRKRRRKKQLKECQNNSNLNNDNGIFKFCEVFNNTENKTTEDRINFEKPEGNVMTSRKNRCRRKIRKESDNTEDTKKEIQKSSSKNNTNDINCARVNLECGEVIKREYDDKTPRNERSRRNKKENNTIEEQSGIFSRSGMITYDEKQNVGLGIISSLRDINIKNNSKRTDRMDIKVTDNIAKKSNRKNKKKTKNIPAETKISEKIIPFHDVYLNTTLNKMFIHLDNFIQNNPRNAFGIFTKVELYLKTLQDLHLHSNCICCVATIVKRTALLFSKFDEKRRTHEVNEVIRDFLYDIDTLVVASVKIEDALNWCGLEKSVKNFVYRGLNLVLFNYTEKIILIFWEITGVVYHNPIYHECKKAGYNFDDVFYFIKLAQGIRNKRNLLQRSKAVI